MQSLASMLRSFEPPRLTAEQMAENERLAREAEERERRQLVASRLRKSGVPSDFYGARLDQCDSRVRAWFSGDRGKGLLLQGEPGRGKTHAACACLIAEAERHMVRFTTMDALLRDVRATFAGMESERDVVSRFVNTRLLCLDDVGKERLTEWSMPIFFSIIDSRYANGKPTIVTTNYTGADLMRCFTVNGDVMTAKALVSRMAGYERIVLEGDDRRMRHAG